MFHSDYKYCMCITRNRFFQVILYRVFPNECCNVRHKSPEVCKMAARTTACTIGDVLCCAHDITYKSEGLVSG